MRIATNYFYSWELKKEYKPFFKKSSYFEYLDGNCICIKVE